MTYADSLPFVDLRKFLGKWYMIAGRRPLLDGNACNAVESYHWNHSERRIDVLLSYRKGSFDGEKILRRQRAWVEDQDTQARWKVRAFWPVSFGTDVLALAADYSWAILGTSNRKHLWVLSQVPEMSNDLLYSILQRAADRDFRIHGVRRIPQRHEIADRIRIHSLDEAC